MITQSHPDVFSLLKVDFGSSYSISSKNPLKVKLLTVGLLPVTDASKQARPPTMKREFPVLSRALSQAKSTSTVPSVYPVCTTLSRFVLNDFLLDKYFISRKSNCTVAGTVVVVNSVSGLELTQVKELPLGCLMTSRQGYPTEGSSYSSQMEPSSSMHLQFKVYSTSRVPLKYCGQHGLNPGIEQRQQNESS